MRVDQSVGRIDRFELTGSARLGGTLYLTLENPELTKQGLVDFGNVFAAAGGGTLDGLKVTTSYYGPSSVIQSFTAAAGSGGINLKALTDFTPEGTLPRNVAVGEAIAAAQAAGSSSLFKPVVLAVLGTQTADELSAVGLNVGSEVRLPTMTAALDAEAGYTFGLSGGANLSPFVGFAPKLVRLGRDSESFEGLGEGLRYHRSSVSSVPAYLGLRFDGQVKLGDHLLEPLWSVAWMHDFDTNRAVRRSFADAPGVILTGDSISTVRDAAAIEVGARYRFGDSVSLQLLGEGQISGRRDTYGAQLRLQVTW